MRLRGLERRPEHLHLHVGSPLVVLRHRPSHRLAQQVTRRRGRSLADISVAAELRGAPQILILKIL